jgi:hypothetical protein
MNGLPADTGVWLAAGVTDMRAGVTGAFGEMAVDKTLRLDTPPHCPHTHRCNSNDSLFRRDDFRSTERPQLQLRSGPR